MRFFSRQKPIKGAPGRHRYGGFPKWEYPQNHPVLIGLSIKPSIWGILMILGVPAFNGNPHYDYLWVIVIALSNHSPAAPDALGAHPARTWAISASEAPIAAAAAWSCAALGSETPGNLWTPRAHYGSLVKPVAKGISLLYLSMHVYAYMRMRKYIIYMRVYIYYYI